MQRRIGLISVFVLAAATVGGCQSSSGDSGGNSGLGGGQVVEYHGDYQNFASAKELAGRADTVIEGQITSSEVQEVTLRPQRGGSAAENPAAGTGRDPAADSMTMVYTVSTVVVGKVHKGAVKPGDKLLVKQPGGVLAGVDYRAERFQLALRSSYLMFLETYPDGTPASLLNQSQAAYTVAADGSYVAGPGNTLTVSPELLRTP